MTNAPPLARRLLAELLGSAFLAALVIGSGIAAQNLSPNDVGLELLENAAATAAGLFTAGIAPASVPGFVAAQLLGGACAILAVRVLYPHMTAAEAAEVVLPHDDEPPSADGPIVQPARS
jgi:glycerol uptake facilitator-like aquaporin